MGSVTHFTQPSIAPIDAPPAPTPPTDRSHLAPIDDLVGGRVDGNAAAVEILPIDVQPEATPTLDTQRERDLAGARASGPAQEREALLQEAQLFTPTEERQLQLDVAQAWGPAQEREVELLRAQATQEGVDPDVAMLLQVQADHMERSGREAEAQALAALEDFEARRDAHYGR